jgi:hypothetical protein
MKITELRIGFARTVNLGNFENARVEADLTAAIEEGDDLAQVCIGLQRDLRSALEETWKAQHKQRSTP